jgi:hypothetical protein
MGYFFDRFPFEVGARMTGVWTARPGRAQDAAMAHLIGLGPGQDAFAESPFVGAHLPLQAGGLHGVGPDGQAWLVVVQSAPAGIAAPVGSRRDFWAMADGIDRALEFNPAAEVLDVEGWRRQDLVDIYAEREVDPAWVDEWTLDELVRGLLAECCYVPLPVIVTGRLRQCAFPDAQHECSHDVFEDVFGLWVTGALNPPEPAP